MWFLSRTTCVTGRPPDWWGFVTHRESVSKEAELRVGRALQVCSLIQFFKLLLLRKFQWTLILEHPPASWSCPLQWSVTFWEAKGASYVPSGTTNIEGQCQVLLRLVQGHHQFFLWKNKTILLVDRPDAPQGFGVCCIFTNPSGDRPEQIFYLQNKDYPRWGKDTKLQLISLRRVLDVILEPPHFNAQNFEFSGNVTESIAKNLTEIMGKNGPSQHTSYRVD